MAVKTKVIMSGKDIERSVARIAMQIVEKNQRVENLVIIGIHTGGVFLAERIQQIIHEREGVAVPLGTLDITLYRDDWSQASLNPVIKQTDISFPIEGKNLILVDDVVFTGRTIRAALDAVMDFGRPNLIELAVLVDRGGRELPIQPDYAGLVVPVAHDEHVHVVLREVADRDKVVLESGL